MIEIKAVILPIITRTLTVSFNFVKKWSIQAMTNKLTGKCTKSGWSLPNKFKSQNELKAAISMEY